MHNYRSIFLPILPMTLLWVSSVLFFACSDNEPVEAPNKDVPETAMDGFIKQMNQDIADLRLLADKQQRVLTYYEGVDGNCVMELENKHIVKVYADVESAKKKTIPVFGINSQGYWVYEYYGQEQPLTDANGQPVAALTATGKGVYTPMVRLNAAKCWEVSFNGVQWQLLSSQPIGKIASATAAAYSPFCGFKANEAAHRLELYQRCGAQSIVVDVLGKGTTEAWNKFLMGADDNVLLDFSYAGYHHGEQAPPDGFSLGYEVMNVKERMESKQLSAREALLDILREKKMTRIGGKNYANPQARVVIYFPEGEYVLHDENDNTRREPVANKTFATDSKGNNTSHGIFFLGGHFVIKGAGRDKTRLIMATPNLPDDANVMYSSPCLFEMKHNSGLGEGVRVTADAKKGTHTVEVSGASKFKKGDWVCLYLKNNDPAVVAQELTPYAAESTMTNLIQEGVQVEDFHQITSISGNRITFKEPIMHEVKAAWNWQVRVYPHYEEVGVEDLTFVGHAVDDFKHHRNWNDDGAYKPLNMVRLTNSWVRRVRFHSVSEAASIAKSANVSAYDITIEGNRGHAAVRSAGSSRVFIGKVTDRTRGPLVDNRNVVEEAAGQYHACGVSKPSMGAVIWRVHWGKDACFESHATQPRATLIDACTGGFMQFRQGGDYAQLPNHLADLTIWNMCSERSVSATGHAAPAGVFDWWRIGHKGWKFLPPVIVGFHGEALKFKQDQVRLDESHGMPVEPASLYEAQLKKRLGEVPAWLNALK